jgi:hypothetical protein
VPCSLAPSRILLIAQSGGVKDTILIKHLILVAINIIVNLAFIIRYTYLFAMAYA